MARKKHEHPHEEEAGEAWLLPYSDLMTLLLALFICLFGISKLNAGKAAQMSASFQSAFNLGGPSFFEGSGTGLGQYAQIGSSTDSGIKAYLAENEQMENIQEKIQEYITENKLEGELSVNLTEGGLLVRISDNALFPSGSAELLPEAQKIVPIVADMLGTMQQQVLISGHTDNVPIATSRYPSNWELSTDRAQSFMRLLMARNPKLDAKRFSVVGYGEFRPAATNETEDGRQKNRRVEVLVNRSYRMPDSAQKLN